MPSSRSTGCSARPIDLTARYRRYGTASNCPNLHMGKGCDANAAASRNVARDAVASRPSIGGEVMKIVVIGGTGLIGSKVVGKMRQKGHEAIAAAPSTGVNTITGEGLAEALADAAV